MGIANPLALVFTALYGVLVFFYLWERWRRQISVPSLLLWQSVREDTLRARRFRPDLLFLLQLVLLTGLIGGLVRPYLLVAGAGTPSARHVFVLDVSASMQAREGRTSRLEQARGQALERLQGLGSDDEVMLVVAARTPQVVINFTRDHGALAAALQAAEPTDTGGDLSLALTFADGARQRSDLPTAVDVFTDIPRSQVAPPLRDRVTIFQVGESDDNVGIEALQIFQGRFQDYRRARAYVLVQNFSHREHHGFLAVQLEQTLVYRTGFSIPARQSKGFLVQDFPASGRVVARLEGTDALAADDVAYGWIRPATPVRVLLVSPVSPLVSDLRDLAAATPGMQLAVMLPEQFAGAPAADADLAIFHRFVPAGPLTIPALYVYPPADNALFPASGDAESIEVLDWDARHAALQSLRPFASLPLQRTRIITPPPTSRVLLWSRSGVREFPLAFATDGAGPRAACIAFDLEAERLLSSDTVNLLLFFMNLLDWLAPQPDDVVVAATGDVQPIAHAGNATTRVRDPHGRMTRLEAGEDTLEPLLAGPYQIENGTRRSLLVNFFDPLESDIGRASREPPVFPAVAAGARVQANPRRTEYSQWLYAVALLFLIVEWAAARRRAP